MPKDVLYGKTLRKSFARTQEIMDMPNLLEIQKSSYKWFLETGLREVFKDVDSVTDYSGNLELSFIDYSMDEKPKYTEEECKARDATYAAPLKVRVRLRNKETEEIKEQEIFMGDFPIMTPGGTFVINGAERVIVSQIVRSPGVYFGKELDKSMISIYSSTVIPYHGAWLEYETDASDVFNVRIDKNRKLPITWFLKAMGAYDENRPATWLSCVDDPFVGAVTNERIKEILKQPQYQPMPVEKQVIIIYAAINKYLMDIPVADILRFQNELFEFIDTKYPEIPGSIAATHVMDDETEKKLIKAIEECKASFR